MQTSSIDSESKVSNKLLRVFEILIKFKMKQENNFDKAIDHD